MLMTRAGIVAQRGGNWSPLSTTDRRTGRKCEQVTIYSALKGLGETSEQLESDAWPCS